MKPQLNRSKTNTPSTPYKQSQTSTSFNTIGRKSHKLVNLQYSVDNSTAPKTSQGQKRVKPQFLTQTSPPKMHGKSPQTPDSPSNPADNASYHSNALLSKDITLRKLTKRLRNFQKMNLTEEQLFSATIPISLQSSENLAITSSMIPNDIHKHRNTNLNSLTTADNLPAIQKAQQMQTQLTVRSSKSSFRFDRQRLQTQKNEEQRLKAQNERKRLMISSDHVSQLLGTLNTIQSSKNEHKSPQHISNIRFPKTVSRPNQLIPQ